MEAERGSAEALMERVRGAWVHYVRTAEPGYTAYRPAGKQLVDAPQATAEFARIYSPDTAQHAHLVALAGQFGQMQRVLEDGNCMYRALLAGLLAYHAQSTRAEKDGAAARLAAALTGYAADTLVLDAARLLASLVRNAGLFGPAYALAVLNQQDVSDALVHMLRRLVGDALAGSPFNPDPEHVSREVYPMGKWAGEAELQAATAVLGVSVGLSDLAAMQRHVYAEAARAPVVELIFKGGHYDVFTLYP